MERKCLFFCQKSKPDFPIIQPAQLSNYNAIGSLLMTNLTHFFVSLLHLSTCFEHHSAHHQGIELN